MKVLKYIPFICFFLVFYIILLPVGFISGSDDTAHFEMMDKLGRAGWILWRAEVWQPRLFSDFFYAVFIYNIGAWKLANALVAALLMFGTWRAACRPDNLREEHSIGQKHSLLLSSSVICLLFFMIYPNVVTSSVIWYTGSFYYLWPVTALIFGLTPFIFLHQGDNPYPKKIWIPVSIFASICAAFTEQTAAVSVGISFLILAYSLKRKLKIPKWIYIHFAAIVIFSFYYITAVFASPRMVDGAEIYLFPEFASYGVLDKLMLGVNIYSSHLIRSSSFLFLILALLAGALSYQRLREKKTIFRVLAYSPAFYILLNVLPFRFLLSGTWNHPVNTSTTIGVSSAFDYDPDEWFNYLHNVPPLSQGNDPRSVFLAIMALVVVLGMLFPVFLAFREKANGILASLLYLAAFCSGIIMGFTPTAFASGARPYFLANIIMLLICMMLIREGMLNKYTKLAHDFICETTRSKILVGIVTLVVVYVIFLYLFYFGASSYWVY